MTNKKGQEGIEVLDHGTTSYRFRRGAREASESEAKKLHGSIEEAEAYRKERTDERRKLAIDSGARGSSVSLLDLQRGPTTPLKRLGKDPRSSPSPPASSDRGSDRVSRAGSPSSRRDRSRSPRLRRGNIHLAYTTTASLEDRTSAHSGHSGLLTNTLSHTCLDWLHYPHQACQQKSYICFNNS